MFFSYTYSERYIIVVDVLIIMLNVSIRSCLSKVLVSFLIIIFTIYFFIWKKFIKFHNRVLYDLDVRWVAVHHIRVKRNIKKITKKMLMKMFITVKISKAFARWKFDVSKRQDAYTPKKNGSLCRCRHQEHYLFLVIRLVIFKLNNALIRGFFISHK